MMRSRAWPLVAVAVAVAILVATAAGCGRGRSPLPRGPAAQYLAIATVGNRGLEALDALSGRDHGHLAAARADLRVAAATERQFDRSLLAIAFPSAIEATARALVTVNEARAALTSEAAASVSLPQLSRYEHQLSAANARVEARVKTIRAQLRLPPPATS